MEVFVIRHTQVAVGKEVCYGQSDVALADSFADEADEIRLKMPSDFDICYASPIDRARKLAENLNFKEIIFEKRLKEINFGDWEGKNWAEINEADLNKWMANFVEEKAPNGENLIALFGRVSEFFDELRTKNHKKVLIISHAGVIRCVWAYLLKIPLDQIFKIPVEYGEVFSFKLNRNPSFDKIIQKC
jgi:alpha-ribazole phosphatase